MNQKLYSIVQITRAYRKTVTSVEESNAQFAKGLLCMKQYTDSEIIAYCESQNLSTLQTSRLVLAL